MNDKIRIWFQAVIRKFQMRLSKTEQRITSDKKALSVLPNNPYLQSKVLWNDLYGDVQTKLENSYRIIFILAIVIMIAIIGFVIVAGESKVKPYVTVIHGNEVLTLDQSSQREINTLRPRLAFYFANHFIRALRSVSADRDVNANNQMAAYAFVSGPATETLKQFYANHLPDQIAKKSIKTIQIRSLLRTSSNTIEVRWQENTIATRSGELLSSHQYLAQLQYRFDHPSVNAAVLRVNPLGFYVTHLSWSEETRVKEG